MNYKETLFFIGKCLTINHEEHNKQLIEKELKSNSVDWDSVVKVSTGHFVFPALYCNLKKANYLNYLPDDLVAYMEHITDLNRERNEQIIFQAKEINELLLENGITPIFLKGTGNLLEGLYDDIAERMVGDIDFLVSQEDYKKTIDLLNKNSYKKVDDTEKYIFPLHRHYFRLNKEERIAAVEIHNHLTLSKYRNEFNNEIVSKDTLTINNITLLSYKNQLSLSIIAKQINDYGQFFNNISFRNTYDVFLLSLKTDSLESITNFNKIFPPLNNFLAISNTALNSKVITFKNNNVTQKTTSRFLEIVSKELSQKRISQKLYIKRRLNIIYQSIFNKEYRTWLLNKLVSKKWQQEKANQIGLKNTKPNS